MKSNTYKWVFFVLVAALFAYEGIALWTTAQGDTISEMVWHASDRQPVLIFLFGLLMGHFFWPRRGI